MRLWPYALGASIGVMAFAFASTPLVQGWTTPEPVAASLSLWATLQSANEHLGSESEYLGAISEQLSSLRLSSQQVLASERSAQSAADSEWTHVAPILRYQYEFGNSDAWMWLSLLTNAQDWQSLMSILSTLEEVRRQRTETLASYVSAVRRLQMLERQYASSQEDLNIALQCLKTEQALYTSFTAQTGPLSQSVAMDRFMSELMSTWRSTIAPNLTSTLAELDKAASSLPNRLPRDTVTISFPTATVHLSQDDFNNILHQTRGLENIRFLFRPSQVMVFATSGGHNLLMSGHWAIASSGKRADFLIDNVAVDGILLPRGTFESLLQPYQFYVDISSVSPHLKLDQVVVQNRQLNLQLSASLD